MHKQFVKTAKNLAGKTIERVGWMSKNDAEKMGWNHQPPVITFTDGTILFPSRDDEGNDAGSIFGAGPNNENYDLPVLRS